MSRDLLLKPRISEKTYALSETGNVYTFDVPRSANKHEVARAIAVQYNVTVNDVRLATVSGKPLRSVRRGGRVQRAKRSDIRKAYVVLKEGDKLPLFSAVGEEVKADKKAEK